MFCLSRFLSFSLSLSRLSCGRIAALEVKLLPTLEYGLGKSGSSVGVGGLAHLCGLAMLGPGEGLHGEGGAARERTHREPAQGPGPQPRPQHPTILTAAVQACVQDRRRAFGEGGGQHGGDLYHQSQDRSGEAVLRGLR